MLGPNPEKRYRINLVEIDLDFFQVQTLRDLADKASPQVSAAINSAIARTDWWDDKEKFSDIKE